METRRARTIRMPGLPEVNQRGHAPARVIDATVKRVPRAPSTHQLTDIQHHPQPQPQSQPKPKPKPQSNPPIAYPQPATYPQPTYPQPIYPAYPQPTYIQPPPPNLQPVATVQSRPTGETYHRVKRLEAQVSDILKQLGSLHKILSENTLSSSSSHRTASPLPATRISPSPAPVQSFQSLPQQQPPPPSQPRRATRPVHEVHDDGLADVSFASREYLRRNNILD